MKVRAKEIVPADEMARASEGDDGVCECCHIADMAEEKLDNAIQCPHCGEKCVGQFLVSTKDLTVVGEGNYYDPEHFIRKMQLQDCPHCGKKIGFEPVAVSYNGNHDIYYTGGRNYLPASEIKLPETVDASIQQFCERIRAGEKGLDTWHLRLWIERDVSAYIAKTLYEHGMKI